MLEKFKMKLLNSSDSYNFYKREYEVLTKDLDKKVNELTKENKKLNKKLKNNEKVLNSYYSMFENIYLNHELQPVGIWAKLQLLEQELMTFIDNVCKKYDLDYWLDYGTLIGAVRHGGFIPWDDDIDLGMMRRDFEKIHPILEEEIKLNNLEKDIDLRLYHENVNNNIVSFIQFTYRYPNFGITMSNVDIFPYDYKKEDNITDKLYYKERDRFHGNLDKKGNPEDIVKEFMTNLDLTYEESDYIIPGPEAPRGVKQYKYTIYDKNVIFPLTTMKFKDRIYKCPNDSDTHLRGIYGNYTEIPKVIVHHNLVRVLKTVDNIDEEFDIAIDKMRKINESFNFDLE